MKLKVYGKFQRKWIAQFKAVTNASQTGIEYAHCAVCARDVKVAASGAYMDTHLATVLHKTNEAKAITRLPMTSFFTVKPQTSAAITKAEVFFEQFVAECSLSASVADHFTDFVKVMFSDGNIAKSFRADVYNTDNK